MDREELSRRLMATFVVELADHVRALNRDLLALEKSGEGEERARLLGELFRTAHSLKGASRSVNVGVLESLSHRLEERIGSVRDGRSPFTPEVFKVLFRAADAIQDAGERLRARRDLAGAPAHAVLAELTGGTIEGGGGSPLPTPVPGPASVGAAPVPGVVRVRPEKLDGLVARSGEALVARRRLEVRREDVAALHEAAAGWRVRWKRDARALRKAAAGRVGPHASPEDGPPHPETGVDRALRTLEGNAEFLGRVDEGLAGLATHLSADLLSLERAAGALDESVLQIRMLPFSEACEGLARTARDLAAAGGKEVDLALGGEGVDLDRAVLDRLRDPLLHLVRNAIDHGIERPAERSAAGKPPAGRVRVSAALRGARVEVLVEDDGRGVDSEVVREAARERGFPAPADAREALRLLFLPGFSTARTVTKVSGRGVGLDVVRKAVEALHGSVECSSERGRGARFVLSVPLTLTTLRALFVSAGGQDFAIPSGDVRALLRVDAGGIRSVEGKEVVLHEGAPVPLSSLATVLGLPGRAAPGTGRKLPVVVLAVAGRLHAFLVEDLLAEREILVKGLGPRLVRVRNVAGATILPTGKVALILNSLGLVEAPLGHPGQGEVAAALAGPAAKTRKRLLLAEDSVTTRTLEKSILEAEGYEVLAAPDGAAAWQMLQERGADLVVSDVDMPRMDGFALTEAIRASKRFRDLPVVLVTALESGKDRARGLEAGADAYLVKSAFDQRSLLDAVARLL